MKTAKPIILSPEERFKLNAWAGGRSIPLRLVQRVQIVAAESGCGRKKQDPVLDFNYLNKLMRKGRGLSDPAFSFEDEFLKVKTPEDEKKRGRMCEKQAESISASASALLLPL